MKIEIIAQARASGKVDNGIEGFGAIGIGAGACGGGDILFYLLIRDNSAGIILVDGFISL